MNTEQLINTLSEGSIAVDRNAYQRRYLGMLALGMILSLATVIMSIGVRPDLAAAFQTPFFTTKLTYCLAMFGLSAFLLSKFLTPYPMPLKKCWPLLIPVAVIVALALYQITSIDNLGATIVNEASFFCLKMIAAFGALPLVLFVAAGRAWAPANPQMAGLMAGLCAGASGAFAYALFCVHDDPLFVSIWYSIAWTGFMALGYLLGRFLRW